MANGNEQYMLNEDVSFIQHFLPGLDAGEYQLQVQQQLLQSDGTTKINDNPYTNTYTFAVTADRFALSNPALIIDSVYPATNATGEYSNVLPHVVFNKTTFPWARYPTLVEPTSGLAAGGDVEQDVPTWLWVMLLDEDDVTNYPSLQLDPVNRTIGDLYPKTVYQQSTLAAGDFSYFYEATDLKGLEPGQNTSDSILAIDVPLALFWSIGPSLADLNLLAHSRIVSLINKPTDGSNELGEPTGAYSIVFGNRLPNDQKKTYAYLVSLEELQDFLPQTGGLPPSGTTKSPTANLRLAVLKSWTFFSTGESATFVHQLESLNGCTPGGPPATNTNIRLDYNGSNKLVQTALSMGYVPLNELMRTAELNVSWYRGPLIPYQITTNNISFPITSQDAALQFDPTTGMLDTSYAAAWTIGRMVALQDVAFSTGLYNWKRSLEQQVAANLENDMIAQEFGETLRAPGDTQTPVNAASLFKQTVLSLKTDK
jgi:hypothetical protein